MLKCVYPPITLIFWKIVIVFEIKSYASLEVNSSAPCALYRMDYLDLPGRVA